MRWDEQHKASSTGSRHWLPNSTAHRGLMASCFFIYLIFLEMFKSYLGAFLLSFCTQSCKATVTLPRKDEQINPTVTPHPETDEVMLLLGDAATVMASRSLPLCSTRGDSEGSAKPWESIPTLPVGSRALSPAPSTASAAKIPRLRQRRIISIPRQIPIPPGEQRHRSRAGCTLLSVPVPSVRADRGAAQPDPTRGAKALQVIPELRQARFGVKSRRDADGFQQSWHCPGKR